MRLYKRSTRPSRSDQFDKAWDQLKEAEKLTLILHSSQLHCVLNGVQKKKSFQNVLRRRLGLPGFGTLKAKTEPCADRPGFILLHMVLTFNSDNL